MYVWILAEVIQEFQGFGKGIDRDVAVWMRAIQNKIVVLFPRRACQEPAPSIWELCKMFESFVLLYIWPYIMHAPQS